MTVIRRKLYKRGSSVETTIPKPLLFALNMDKKHNVMFHYDHVASRWYIDFEEITEKGPKQGETPKRAPKRKTGERGRKQ